MKQVSPLLELTVLCRYLKEAMSTRDITCQLYRVVIWRFWTRDLTVLLRYFIGSSSVVLLFCLGALWVFLVAALGLLVLRFWGVDLSVEFRGFGLLLL